ncbi:hypothetical protein DVA86_24330 [Streptomyces armeniacus]|uniref:SurA N-terminal domain-containing protein n=1 Tax=Streptomyces armeniacus TaxID=83291 RepID=A0A345XUI7_9ACTN|nr:SurA N-terminal domain-containing protein [Streptomyces armeniacus]AXK35303.1 hypothetical protein DVA86_24330 [Streptomyces armeniacus]
MHRRRSALTVSTAAVLAVVAPLLTGCGSDARPGAAAVVDGDRITMAQLQSRVGAVRDAQNAEPQGEQLVQRSGQLTRATLDSMIRERVVREAADEAGVSVSRREIQRMRDQLEKGAGGAKQFEAALLQQQAIAPSEIDERVWLELAVRKIAGASGIDLQTPEGNEALTAKFAETAKKMKIDVNPRYGKWSTRQAALAAAKDPWLNDLSGKEAEREQQQAQQPQGT